MPWTTPSICLTSGNTRQLDAARTISYRQAIREGLQELLCADQHVFLLGEGIDDASGVFGTTLGLAEEFGKDRVMDTPLAENGITGVAIGAALAGLRPVYIHMRPDFLLLSLDQLLNHAAKWCYMTGGKVSVPLTVRCVIGRGWGSAAQHSQAVQGLLIQQPGIKVVMPATAHDAKGLLVSAVRDPNPVVILEHRWIFDKEGYVPEGLYEVPIGKAMVCRQGAALTIVANSVMVHEAMRAADELAEQGVDAEIIDLRSIKPWDEDTVAASVAKTGRLLVIDTGHIFGGIAAEVAARMAERCWSALRAPIGRIGFPEAPVPASHVLEACYYPDWQDIANMTRELMNG